MFRRHARAFVIGFFVLYFLLGVLIFRQYGLSWDEPTSRDNGIIAYQYVTGQNRDLLTYRDRDYGTAFELPLVFIEKMSGLTASRDIYYLRHFLTFLLFFTGAIFFYRTAYGRFGQRIAFLGTVLLILSPRIFADSFYNSKDMALLAGMTIAIFTLISFLKKPSFKGALLHAMASAFIVDIRLPGLIILPLTLAFFSLDTLLLSSRRFWLPRFKIVFLYFVFFMGFAVLFWPYLWNNPAGNLLEAFSNFSRFERYNDTVLYLGNYVKANFVPWHYPLVWISISTPLVYLGFFFIGIGFTVFRFFKDVPGFYKAYRLDVIFLAWFFTPLFMVLVFNSALYDSWRQLYFIYPALILTALIGFEGLLKMVKKHKRVRIVFGVLMVVGSINLVSVLSFMISYHPYQNLYFNQFAGGMQNAKQNFDLDYWGLTFREGLEYIAKQDTSSGIPVFFAHGHKGNIDILREEDKKRFLPLDKPQGAKYIFSNYRWYKDVNNYRYQWDPSIYTAPHEEIYNIIIDDAKVMTVFKQY